MPVAALLGGATGRITLDQEQFGLGGVTLLAIGKLAGQAGNVHHALAPGQLARLFRGLARGGGVDHLGDDRAAMRGVFLQPFGELVRHQAFKRLAHFGGHQLVLGLRTELGIGELDRDDRGQPLAHVIAGQRDLFLLQQPRLVSIIVERAGERGAEGGQMRAAIALRDVVGEAQDVFVIAVIPFQRDVDGHIVARAIDGDRLGHQRLLVAIEPLHERGDPAFIIELHRLAIGMARIGEEQPNARIEEGQLTIAMFELVEIELGNLEGGGARQEGDARALLVRRAEHLQRRDRITEREAHIMLLPVAPDVEIKPFAERVDHRHANAVQPARHLVGIAFGGIFKLTAGVQLGHDDFGRRHAFFGVDAGGDAAAIILDRHRAIGVERDVDPVAMPGQRFVDRIVRHFEHHVVQAGTIIGIADIHAGAFADCVEPFEHLDRIGAVIVRIGVFCHGKPIGFVPRKRKQNGRVRIAACT